jgi:hypothetical protein
MFDEITITLILFIYESVYAQQVKTELTTMEGKHYAKADQVGICNPGK